MLECHTPFRGTPALHINRPQNMLSVEVLLSIHAVNTIEGSGVFSFGVSLAEIIAGPAAPAP